MPPALRALLLLLGAGAAVLLVAVALPTIAPPAWLAAVLTGVLAALGARWWRMDGWWPPLLAVFPLAVWLALRLPVAPLAWGIGGLLLLLAYGGVYRTQVPLFLSRRDVWRVVLAELPPPAPDRRPRFVDLGSGFGGLPRFIGRARPDVDCRGVELAPLPAAIAWLRQRAAPLPNVSLRRGDLWSEPLARADLAFAFLSPVPMAALWRKVADELPPGAALISCEFAVPDVTPTAVRASARRRLFVYRRPQSAVSRA